MIELRACVSACEHGPCPACACMISIVRGSALKQFVTSNYFQMRFNWTYLLLLCRWIRPLDIAAVCYQTNAHQVVIISPGRLELHPSKVYLHLIRHQFDILSMQHFPKFNHQMNEPLILLHTMPWLLDSFSFENFHNISPKPQSLFNQHICMMSSHHSSENLFPMKLPSRSSHSQLIFFRFLQSPHNPTTYLKDSFP